MIPPSTHAAPSSISTGTTTFCVSPVFTTDALDGVLGVDGIGVTDLGVGVGVFGVGVGVSPGLWKPTVCALS